MPAVPSEEDGSHSLPDEPPATDTQIFSCEGSHPKGRDTLWLEAQSSQRGLKPDARIVPPGPRGSEWRR